MIGFLLAQLGICSHPARLLMVQSRHPTVAPDTEDFETVTFHLRCIRCDKPVDISCAAMVGGVDAFLGRGRTTSSGRKGAP